MKKFIFKALIFFSLIALGARFGSQPLLDVLFSQNKAGLRITAVPEAVIFINGVEVGQTPYQDENLKAGEYKVELKANGGHWQGIVKLTGGTLSIVNRELALSTASSSGEILSLSPGKGVVLTSTPTGAEVEIDGKIVGKTPLSLSGLEVGEHTFLLSHLGYLKRSIRATLPEKMQLNINVDLAISEVDLSNITVPPLESTNKKVIAKQTSVGFLRVREKPTTGSKEITRVAPGEELVLLEELSNWDKVRLSDGTEGYVSSLYVQKQP